MSSDPIVIAPGPLPDPPEGLGRIAGILAAPDGTPRWPAWMSFAALGGALGAAILGGAIVALIALVFGSDLTDPPPAVNIVSTVFQDLAFIAAALFFARTAGRVTPAAFGLRRVSSFWWAVLWVVVGYLGFIFLSGLWLTAIGADAQDDLPDELGADESTVALVAVMVLVTVVAPIAEEFLFRGFFFPALRTKLGLWWAAALTGVVFGGIHVLGSPVEFLLPLALFGFVLCLVYWRTNSLYPCIALHAFNNSLAFGTSQDWDWQIPLVVLGSFAACAAIVLPLAGRFNRRVGAPAQA